jgi:hypothetical protein
LTRFDRTPPRQRIIVIVIVILLLGVWAFGLTRFDRPAPERRALLGQVAYCSGIPHTKLV